MSPLPRPWTHKSAGRTACRSPLCPDSDQILRAGGPSGLRGRDANEIERARIIHDGQELEGSINSPDTEALDQLLQLTIFGLQRAAGQQPTSGVYSMISSAVASTEGGMSDYAEQGLTPVSLRTIALSLPLRRKAGAP
jgi:hypothetical protein